jgi:hypothetical protein
MCSEAALGVWNVCRLAKRRNSHCELQERSSDELFPLLVEIAQHSVPSSWNIALHKNRVPLAD